MCLYIEDREQASFSAFDTSCYFKVVLSDFFLTETKSLSLDVLIRRVGSIDNILGMFTAFKMQYYN